MPARSVCHKPGQPQADMGKDNDKDHHQHLNAHKGHNTPVHIGEVQTNVYSLEVEYGVGKGRREKGDLQARADDQSHPQRVKAQGHEHG